MTDSKQRPRARAAHLGPERRRPLVLDAALELFLERGYDGTSIEAIAKAAKVSRAVVYDCFANKEALFGALLKREEQRLIQHLLAAIPPDPPLDDPEALLQAGFTGFLLAASKAPSSWRIVFAAQESGHAEIARRVQAARDMITEQLSRLAAASLASQGVAEPDSRMTTLIAYLIVGQAEASMRLLLDRPDEWTPEELGATVGALNAASLRAR